MKQLKTLLLEDAAYYDAQMNEIKLSLFAEQLAPYDVTEVQRAMAHFRNQANRRQMPMPADIIAFLNPVLDDDAASKEVASRIVAAVKKFGYTNPEEAKTYMGDIGWKIVERRGGWTHLCETLNDRDLGTFQAQARDLAKAQIQIARSGMGDTAPSLPAPQGGKVQNLISNLSKQKALTGGKNEI